MLFGTIGGECYFKIEENMSFDFFFKRFFLNFKGKDMVKKITANFSVNKNYFEVKKIKLEGNEFRKDSNWIARNFNNLDSHIQGFRSGRMKTSEKNFLRFSNLRLKTLSGENILEA